MLKNKITMLLWVALSLSIITCDALAKKSYKEEEIGIRKSNLYNEKLTLKDSVEYSNKMPGESKLIERSFENAPPLIPHSVEGLLPISANNNACLGCHEPAAAKAINGVPVPKSHLVSYRPIMKYKEGNLTKNGEKYANTSDVRTSAHKRDGVSSDRFNCSQCHVPQTSNKPLVKNEFNPVFRSKDGNSTSNLADILDEGVSYRKLK